MIPEEEQQKKRWDLYASSPGSMGSYDKFRCHPVSKAVDKIYVELVQGNRILEIGCGAGHLLEHISGSAKQFNMIGMDISVEMLEIAKSKGLTSLVCGSGNSLPFQDGSFDTVIAGHWVFRYLDAELALTEAYRVLRRGGILLFDVPLYWRWALRAFGNVIRGKYSWKQASVKERLELNVRRPSIWISYLRKVGFEPISRIGILDIPRLTTKMAWAPMVTQYWAQGICSVLFIHARRPLGTRYETPQMAEIQSYCKNRHDLDGVCNTPEKNGFINVLICPTCRNKLEMKANQLSCVCGRNYQIVDEIPVIFPE